MKKCDIVEIDGVSYTLRSPLGSGGAGEVWKVQSSDGQMYALKRVEKGKGSSDRDERFRKEIEFGIAASHRNVVKIHAKNEETKHFNYTMDLYSKSLREVFDEELGYELLLNYLTQLCDGLAYVHAEGVVHRDIKPENILVDTQTRQLVLADFGIAHFKDSFLTKRGDLLVNRNYLAPEQMIKNNARGVGKAADIFALGLIITEAFTKQNSRGARHKRIGDIHPFLSDLDLLVERMTLQDETRRIEIDAVRDSLDVISRQVESKIDDVRNELRPSSGSSGLEPAEINSILDRAGRDVLSARFIFERTANDELSRYNLNYHCEVSYRASWELFNTCVQSKIYSLCKKKFEYEGQGHWDTTDSESIVCSRKATLLEEFESIQSDYPVSEDSVWSGLPRMALHYFRFIKDYHCEELIENIRETVSGSGGDSLQSELLDAPIIWLAMNARKYLETDLFEATQWHREQLQFDRQVGILWDGTRLEDTTRIAAGGELFDKPLEADSIAQVLLEFRKSWDVSVGERVDGKYSIHFRSDAEYARFRQTAINIAAPSHVLEGDVLDMLRTAAKYDDLVGLVWEPTYDICVTLAKVLGLRDISHVPTG